MSRLLVILVLLELPLAAIAAEPRGPATRALQERRTQWQEAQRKMKAPRPELWQLHSPQIAEAMQDPERFWAFLIDPGTPYTLRRATAVQGARNAFPIEMLPRLMAALAELDREQRLHWWALRPHHMDSLLRGAALSPLPQGERPILGHPWVVPTERSDHPLIWDEESQAPWPWQVQQALRDLFVCAAPRTDREREIRWLQVCLRLPLRDDEDAARFIEAARLCYNKSMPVMARWRQIALEPRFPKAASVAAFEVAEACRMWDDDRAQSVGQVITIDILRLSRDKEVRSRAAGHVYSLRERVHQRGEGAGASIARIPEPVSTILALSAAAIDPLAGDPWDRLYTYAFSACRAMDEPPFSPDRRVDPKSPEVGKLLDQYREWFEAHRGELEVRAKAEAGTLEAVRQELVALGSEGGGQ